MTGATPQRNTDVDNAKPVEDDQFSAGALQYHWVHKEDIARLSQHFYNTYLHSIYLAISPL